MTEATVSVQAIAQTVGTIFTEAMGWVTEVATKVATTPMLLLFACIPLVGLGIGLFKRLLNVN